MYWNNLRRLNKNSNFETVKNLNFEGNLYEDYKVWQQQRYDFDSLIAGITDKEERIQVATILHNFGISGKWSL